MKAKKVMTVCQNCGNKCDIEKLKVSLGGVPRLTERIAAGEEVPAGECNKCGCLCHVIPQPKGLLKPLTVEEARKRKNGDRLRVELEIPFSEIQKGIDSMNEFASLAIVDAPNALEDISYTPMGVRGDCILFIVDSNVEPFLFSEDNNGKDVCSKCEAVAPYGTMKAISQTSFDLLCDKCRKAKRAKKKA